MPVVADDVGQVLGQRAAECDVEHLHTPAHREYRQIAVQRGAQQGQLERVARRTHAAAGRMRLLAVPGGIDVTAAGEHQAVQGSDQRVRCGLHRWQQHRDAARPDDRVDVDAGQQGRLMAPRQVLHMFG